MTRPSACQGHRRRVSTDSESVQAMGTATLSLSVLWRRGSRLTWATVRCTTYQVLNRVLAGALHMGAPEGGRFPTWRLLLGARRQRTRRRLYSPPSTPQRASARRARRPFPTSWAKLEARSNQPYTISYTAGLEPHRPPPYAHLAIEQLPSGRSRANGAGAYAGERASITPGGGRSYHAGPTSNPTMAGTRRSRP